jgi:hypothetical protein
LFGVAQAPAQSPAATTSVASTDAIDLRLFTFPSPLLASFTPARRDSVPPERSVTREMGGARA